jgi:hypothetical protein
MSERRLAVCIGFLVPLAMVACGRTTSSGVNESSRPPVIGVEFASRVKAVCQAALEQKQAQGQFPYPDFNPTQPDLSKLPGIAAFEATTVTIFKTWQHKMLALGQPPTGRTKWASVLAALSSHVRIIAEQQAAALRGDGPTFTEDYYEGNTAQDEMVRAADAAGVPDCATAAGA